MKALAPVNYTNLPPYRWYGVGDVSAPYQMERHAIERSVLPGQWTTALCGLELTVDVMHPNRVGRLECAECVRLWRQNTGMSRRPQSNLPVTA